MVNEAFEGLALNEEAAAYAKENVAADLATQIDDAVQKRVVVDWRANDDVKNAMRNDIDDLLYLRSRGPQLEVPLKGIITDPWAGDGQLIVMPPDR